MSNGVLTRLRSFGRAHFAPAVPAAAPPNEPEVKPLTPAQQVVRAGGEMLAGRFPGWYQHINLASLNISGAYSCILGQLGLHSQEVRKVLNSYYGGPLEARWTLQERGPYAATARALGLENDDVQRYGFVGNGSAGIYTDDLTQAWREYIVSLRCAD